MLNEDTTKEKVETKEKTKDSETKIEQLDFDNLDWDSMEIFSVEKHLDFSQGNGEGKKYNVIVYSFNPEKKETGHSKQTRVKNPNIEPKFYNSVVLKIDDTLYHMYASESQARALLSSGLEPQKLPLQGTVCTWLGTSSHPSLNFRFDNCFPKPKRELDDLLDEYKNLKFGKNDPEAIKQIWEAIEEIKNRLNILEA